MDIHITAQEPKQPDTGISDQGISGAAYMRRSIRVNTGMLNDNIFARVLRKINQQAVSYFIVELF